MASSAKIKTKTKTDSPKREEKVEEKCMICQELLTELQCTTMIPCKHEMHFKCLKSYAKKQESDPKCPLCRQSIEKYTVEENIEQIDKNMEQVIKNELVAYKRTSGLNAYTTSEFFQELGRIQKLLMRTTDMWEDTSDDLKKKVCSELSQTIDNQLLAIMAYWNDRDSDSDTDSSDDGD